MIARLVFLVSILAWSQTAAEPFALIISGSGGQSEYHRRFSNWGERLRHVLSDELAYTNDRVYLLHAPQDSLAQIKTAITQTVARLHPDDALFVFLIGHGSYRNKLAKLNLPGPDLSAPLLDSLLAPVRRLTLVNSASQSAAFINTLSGPGRVLCTSTKSVEERNAPRFMEDFIAALSTGDADQNRDERISIFEACQQAAALTQAHYRHSNYLSTEHALLDDDGDGLGSRLIPFAPGSTDGTLARRTYLKDIRLAAPPELIEDYQRAIAAVEALVEKKTTMAIEDYYRQLEALLAAAARLNRRLRQAGQ